MNKEMLNDLRELLTKGTATTQEDICSALIKKGYDINQSKVSRMLRKLGAVKSKNEFGDFVYRISKEPAPPTMSSVLSSLVLNVACNETLIVINTSPGSASMISRLLDYHHDKIGILGTIAGDDTILVVPQSIKLIPQMLEDVKAILWFL